MAAERSVQGPASMAPAANLWQRISPRLVPVLAVLTALIITVPFMFMTGAQGDFGRGLNIAGTAYSALLEGSTGLAVNDIVSRDNLDQVLALAQGGDLSRTELRSLARDITSLDALGADAARRFAQALPAFADLDDEQLDELARSVPEIEAVGPARLATLEPLIVELEALPRADVRGLAEDYARLDALSAEDRAALEALAPAAANYDDAALLDAMALVNEQGIVALNRLVTQAFVLETYDLDPSSSEGAVLAELAALNGGAAAARTAANTITRLDAAGVAQSPALSEQIEVVRSMYSANLLTDDDVTAALNNELDGATANNLIVRRPGNRLIVAQGSSAAGVIWADGGTPDDPSDDKPDTVYLRLGGSALLFFPSNLESTLVRSIPFIIAGLAVALGFKAGLFNIGAEGQIYAGGILAVWVGFSPIFADLPMFIHLPLVIIVGIFGGLLWGAIPGLLRAYTGAHEVILTIMLNYIAIRLVDWLIKSTNPIILLDPTASTPRTPFINPDAILPRFSELSPLAVIAIGVVVAVLGLWSRRARLAQDIRFAIRPIVYGLLVVVIGLFLSWITVRGALHIGFILMLLAVWVTDWFLNRTTLGFELRTVGTNPDAARYSGMSVRRNLVLGLALSGALAGLAGAIEISGVQYNMQPEFFSGVGFDAIAVALLARTNPRNMIWAGLLWGSLLSGAALMQVRADISIDLVKIIQALIIMFIAADAIIRYLWRVPRTSERLATTFSKGWGS